MNASQHARRKPALNQEHYDLLKQGIDVWNAWRKEYRNTRPNLRLTNLNLTNLSCTDLRDADLSDADLIGTDLRHANLKGADLSRANLGSADLKSADFGGADLSRANLGSADLKSADLKGADLTGVNLVGAILRDTNLVETILSDANLGYANLEGANLDHASLKGANLDHAHLDHAHLKGADFDGADLSGAYLFRTTFAENDLSTVKGLVEINHRGRSYLSLDTIKLPQDGSALHFLRGAGVSDEWIDFYRSTMMNPIQYHSCFISYSSDDGVLARRLHADLQDQGVRCWFAPHDLRPGQLFRKGIDEAIHMQDKLLLILSERSVESGWVEYEVETALAREARQRREILFPIRIDEAVFHSSTSWARELQEKRHIGDFREWTDPKRYQEVFKLLLRDLKAQT